MLNSSLTRHEFMFFRYLMEDEGEMIGDIIESIMEDNPEDPEDGYFNSFFDDGTPNEELYKVRNSLYAKLMNTGAQLGYITQEEADKFILERNGLVYLS